MTLIRKVLETPFAVCVPQHQLFDRFWKIPQISVIRVISGKVLIFPAILALSVFISGKLFLSYNS
jgi:hypothetical protein